MVKARRSRNPFKWFQEFMEHILEDPFTRTRLEPAKLARKLEHAMEDNLFFEAGARRLAPNEYDIYLSTVDHQRFLPGQQMLIRDLQNHLVAQARKEDYVLNKIPVLRLHGEPDLKRGEVRIEASLSDSDQAGGTKVIRPEEMAQLFGKPLPGQQSPSSPSHAPSVLSQPLMPTPSMPQAWLTIRLPGGGQEVYRIEKVSVKIGRQLDNDIIVQDKRVSRYHATIDYQPNGQFTITDLGSTNHITINGVATQDGQQVVLRSGDRFTIGNYNFYFERR